MVRYITKDTQFEDSNGKTHLMRQGDRVAIYPPAIHKDPEIFDEPTVRVTPYTPRRKSYAITCLKNTDYK